MYMKILQIRSKLLVYGEGLHMNEMPLLHCPFDLHSWEMTTIMSITSDQPRTVTKASVSGIPIQPFQLCIVQI